jgi:hypothetical protein
VNDTALGADPPGSHRAQEVHVQLERRLKLIGLERGQQGWTNRVVAWRTIDPPTSLIPPGEIFRIDGISVARPYRASEVRPQRSAQLAGWAR